MAYYHEDVDLELHLRLWFLSGSFLVFFVGLGFRLVIRFPWGCKLHFFLWFLSVRLAVVRVKRDRGFVKLWLNSGLVPQTCLTLFCLVHIFLVFSLILLLSKGIFELQMDADYWLSSDLEVSVTDIWGT